MNIRHPLQHDGYWLGALNWAFRLWGDHNGRQPAWAVLGLAFTLGRHRLGWTRGISICVLGRYWGLIWPGPRLCYMRARRPV